METTLTPPRGILFDLDGVLADTEGSYTRFWDDIGRRYPTGIPHFATAIKGTNLQSILALWPDEATRNAVSRAIRHYDSTMAYPLFPATMPLLHELQRRGIALALVTSSDKVKMASLARQHPQLMAMFAAVVDGSMVSRSKPDPEGYLRGAAALGLDAADCWVVEDSLQGVQAGQASGATVVGIATTLPAEVLAPHCSIVLPAIDKLLGLLGPG